MRMIFLLLMPVLLNAQHVNLLENPESRFHLWKTSEFGDWTFEDGVLSTDGQNADLVTNEIFGDFVLEFEYKIGNGGNSGIIYKVLEDPDNPKLFETHSSGPEYQLLDDRGYKGKVLPNQKSGSNYGLDAPMKTNLSKPGGHWNTGKIEVRENKIKHWLNGTLVVEYTYGDDVWKAKVAKTKFAEWPYAEPHHSGRIALQDHGDPIWFRKLLIWKL